MLTEQVVYSTEYIALVETRQSRSVLKNIRHKVFSGFNQTFYPKARDWRVDQSNAIGDRTETNDYPISMMFL